MSKNISIDIDGTTLIVIVFIVAMAAMVIFSH